ncbi:oxaloacetate decarboxylase [Pseudomonadota bacterium]
MSEQTKSTLDKKLSNGEFICAPGVFDLISAKIADAMNFPALYMTGYGTVASSLGLPDAGIATYSQMVERVGRISAMVDTPLIADGDTGYGGLLNVDQTVKGYESAGAVAIQLEDQEFPKKCGHTPNRKVIPCDDMVTKIKVALAARTSSKFLIIARTDARTNYGLDEAISRGRAFAEAGADIVFIEAPETVDEMREIGRSIDKPLMANMVDGGKTPLLSVDELKDLGYQIAIFPCTAFLAMGAAVQQVYKTIAEKGTTRDISLPLYDFGNFSKLMGFDRVWEFESRWAGEDSQ